MYEIMGTSTIVFKQKRFKEYAIETTRIINKSKQRPGAEEITVRT